MLSDGQMKTNRDKVNGLGAQIYKGANLLRSSLRRAPYLWLLIALLAASTPVVSQDFAGGKSAIGSWLSSTTLTGNVGRIFYGESAPIAGASKLASTNLNLSPPLSPPVNLTAPSVSNTQIQLQWNAVTGANHYQIERRANITQAYQTVGTSTSTSYQDTSVAANTAYLYRVRAVDAANNASGPSNTRLGVAVTFTDNPLADPQNPSNTVPVKKEHITQLRTAVNAVRAAANLSAATWTYPDLNNALIHAKDVEELRTKLNEALLVLGFTPPSYTDSTLSGMTFKRIYIQELRQAVNGGGMENGAPSVSITSPSTNTNFATGSNIQIIANASDSDGTITKVEFYQGATKIGEDGATPYSYAWNSVSDGSYSLTARAIDNNGYQTSSAAVTISVSKDFNTSRLDPDNAVGQAGEDLLSRNFNWSLPVVGLPGRAGLDIGLSLTYNSLVWTRDATSTQIRYDADQGFPSPGFRLGFPVIEQKYVNSQTGKTSYLMIMPSGARVELRETSTQGVYESADSSYLQLTEGSSLTVRTMDGTQLSYDTNGYRCSQIKDRNGNFISIAYHEDGGINTVTDTLGRTITFNYDAAAGRLLSITQPWKRDTSSGLVDETHTWATFEFSNLTIQTSFSGLLPVGVQNGNTISVLTKVLLADGSRYNFEYTPWGQVYRIRNYAADGTQLNYIGYDLPGSSYLASSSQADCPRFTKRYDYVRDWNNGEEAITTYSAWSAGVASAQVTLPDGTTVYKEFYGTTGWRRGLTTKAEFWSGVSSPQKTTTITWTQDDESLTYRQNPRVKEANVTDIDGNVRRTRVEYTSYGLPSDVYEYKSDALKVLRHTHTDYRIDPTADAVYLNKRVIGLVKARMVYDGNNDDNDSNDILFSKVEYNYDELDEQGLILLTSAGTSTQHDTTNYGLSFRKGRGLMTSVKRINIENASDAATTRIGYNTTGAAIFMRDPSGHQVSVSYADSFSDGVNHNTMAYPTSVTDEDGNSSSLKYNFTMGVAISGVNPKGAKVVNDYDSFGRLEKRSLWAAPASEATTYTSYAYPKNGQEVRASLLLDTGLVSFSLQRFDGAGRIIGIASDHPTGLVGHYSGQKFSYDVMGRQTGQTNPAEINDPRQMTFSQWTPVGDDAAAGWKWATRTYDWKGRPLITTNTDGTASEASYGGCGCAGGEVVTLTGETVPIPVEPAQNGNRRQKVYHDVLGRAVKTEVLNWDGSIYSTTTKKYNVRNQIIRVRQYVGAAPEPEPESEGSGYQTTTFDYDGHGRLWRQHVPAQEAGKYTTYEYNADDTLEKTKDARGAIANFSYNARHLVESITYSVPNGSQITVPPAVSFSYDNAGNRTGMTDGFGSVTYHYDTLSRLTSEDRVINDAATNLNQTFTITYDYTRSGQLKSVTDPFNSQISYAYDQAGRVSTVTGTSFGGVTQYAGDVQYRAWGALKHLNFGNNPRQLDVTYDSRLQVKRYAIAGVMDREYRYFDDGRIEFSQDKTAVNLDSKFDRSYQYDHLGRLTKALTGIEARGGTSTDGKDRPYYETFQYDAMGHLTGRTTKLWDKPTDTMSHSYTNDRNTFFGWSYDADGRILSGEGVSYSYDAAGNIQSIGGNNSTTQAFDGIGQRLKTTKQTVNIETQQPEYETKYYIHSSALGGQVISEVDAQGNKLRSYVYAGGSVLAWQENIEGTDTVSWEHRDAGNTNLSVTNKEGNVLERRELDPLGADAGWFRPPVWNPVDKDSLRIYPAKYDPTSSGVTYDLDGIPMPAEYVMNLMEAGGVQRQFLLAGNINGQDFIRHTNEQIESVGVGLFRLFELSGLTEFEGYVYNTGETRVFSFAHSGSGQRGTDPNVQAAVGKCADSLFGIGLITFKESKPGNDGFFEGILKDGSKTALDNSSVISVANSVRWNDVELGRMGKTRGEDTTPVLGVTIYGGGYDPHINYTASNADAPGHTDQRKTKERTGLPLMLITQIHELGNSISLIMTAGDLMFSSSDPRSYNPRTKKGDADPGQAFEDCFVEEFLRLKNKK